MVGGEIAQIAQDVVELEKERQVADGEKLKRGREHAITTGKTFRLL